MISFENTEVFNFNGAIRGMRNPLNSWDKSDSYIKQNCNECQHKSDYSVCKHNPTHKCFNVVIGENDLGLMKKLINSGSDHRKFMRQIFVCVDITAPLYWWKEMDQYRVAVVSNSCSTMHTLLHKPFEMLDFSFDKLPGYKKEITYFIPEVDDTLEVWVKTKQDDYYEVSNFGRVRHDGRILSGSIQNDGYIRVTIRGKSYPKHRVVAEAFIENPNDYPVVNHIDGNKQNNQVSNLEWCTQSENIKHAYENDMSPKGLNTYKGKFTVEEREKIKKDYDTGLYSHRQLAEKYNVSHSCIGSILNDKYKYADKVNLYETIARPMVDMLNELRDSYLNCEDKEDQKRIWYSIIQLLPSSYNQRRTITLTYENIYNMRKARRNHKLDEWRVGFMDWSDYLPYAAELFD